MRDGFACVALLSDVLADSITANRSAGIPPFRLAFLSGARKNESGVKRGRAREGSFTFGPVPVGRRSGGEETRRTRNGPCERR